MFTSEQVQNGAKSAKSIADVARALGIKDTKSGRTGKLLRGLMPNLVEVLKQNRGEAKASTESMASAVPAQDSPMGKNPYRPGSAYHAIFDEGSKRFWVRAELIAHVAKMTKGTQKTIGFSLAVLMNAKQQSNGGRSSVLKDDQNRIKLVAIPPKAAKAA
ncbi:MAG: hypothetical protein K8T26_01440 [Lentisphaerae bacterium]|nr:hypothetical protein [Lentisphaerota bacterium]